MAYVPVPKDLTKVKTKVAFNLTKRQLVCFGGGALIGVPLFFLLRGPAGNSAAALCMMLVMLPFFPAGDVREERPAAGKDHRQHDPGILSPAPAAPLPDQQLLCRIGAAGQTRQGGV